MKSISKIGDRSLEEFTLINSTGMEVKLLNLGGIITSIKVPNSKGVLENVVLGYETIEQYLQNPFYLGAIVGRYCNRIANGKFELDGNSYDLAKNNSPNHLHGGIKGFDKVFWNVSYLEKEAQNGVLLKYRSAAMEEGYPGNLDVEVQYIITDNNELSITYRASTDKTTLINLTQHSYFNLTGNSSNRIHDHILNMNADYYLPTDSTSIPTGDLAPVDGTPFDFRVPISIGSRIDLNHEQLETARGYDHNFVLKTRNSDDLIEASKVVEPDSGRTLTVFTTQPGIQFYTGNFLEKEAGRSTVGFDARTGFCLETQGFPNAPNEPGFPSVVLHPDEEYQKKTVYKFGIV